jgi:hypothetical protein
LSPTSKKPTPEPSSFRLVESPVRQKIVISSDAIVQGQGSVYPKQELKLTVKRMDDEIEEDDAQEI